MAEPARGAGSPPEAVIVVPCFNEGARLDAAAFPGFVARSPGTRFCFVNDGSRDDTLTVLQRLCREAPATGFVLDLVRNHGKAEAVRRGMLAAFETRAPLAGFWDADLATPLAEIPRFRRVLDDSPQVEIVLGSRVKLLGRSIERSPLRHYLGRVFATGASLTLRLAVYDTQCGAKLFRATPELRRVFEQPFLTRWVFDVEILARYLRLAPGGRAAAAARIHELPLLCWADVPGTKLKPWDFVRSGLELVRIWNAYVRAR